MPSEQNYISLGTVLAVRSTTPPGSYSGVIKMTPKEVPWMMRHVFATLLHVFAISTSINQPTALVATYAYDVATWTTVL
jgi:hypothetical protein